MFFISKTKSGSKPSDTSLTAKRESHSKPSSSSKPRSSSESASTSSQRVRADQKEALKVHNDARKVAPGAKRNDIVWSNTLSKGAQQWAEHLARQKTYSLEHSDARSGGYGENLSWSSGSLTFAEASRYWLAERQHYRGQPIRANAKPMVGHYIQMIVPKVTKVGMGIAKGKLGTYVCARYDAQCVVGHYPYVPTKENPAGTWNHPPI